MSDTLIARAALRVSATRPKGRHSGPEQRATSLRARESSERVQLECTVSVALCGLEVRTEAKLQDLTYSRLAFSQNLPSEVTRSVHELRRA